jgi:hypothetical protein
MALMPNTIPEGTPIHTNVATVPDFNDFLTTAKKFHQVWGLKPISVSSLEDVISDLAKQRGKKSRIRIVTHAFKDLIFLSLFGEDRRINRLLTIYSTLLPKVTLWGLVCFLGIL